jgi:hypothetical protein
LWAGPQAPGTTALSRAAVIKAGPEEELEGIGFVRRVRPLTPDSLGSFETSANGTQFLVLRLPTNGSRTTRLYIRDVALPTGARLFVYGLDHKGLVTNVDGPFEGAGPLESGEFWTETISGTEIVVELQVEEGLPDLPFEIVGLGSSDLSPASTVSAQRGTVEVRASVFRGMELTHTVQDGVAIFEGDIELGNADELPRATGRSKKGSREAVIVTNTPYHNYRWKNGVIPYTVDPALPNPSRITTALDRWNNLLQNNIKWIPRTDEKAFVHFAHTSSASTCSSSVGMLGAQQRINLGSYCSVGNVIHEMGHAAGLWHEQGREDRNKYVKVLTENIKQDQMHNFTQNISNGDDLVVYDYGSIMHYPSNGFSVNGKPTIETIPPGIPIGQRTALSAGDIIVLKAMYPTPGWPPPGTEVTLQSVPSGQTITVDGVNYKTPKTLIWVPGSVHTLSAVNPAESSGTRNVFVRWTDGGAQTHTVVTPSSATIYRADYATSYSAVVTAATPGEVMVAPKSSDNFYAKDSAVAIGAIVPPGSCFTSWTGLIAGTPANTSLKMSKAYTVQANHQPGSLSVSPASLTVPTTASTQQIGVTSTASCAWSASSPVTWIKITSGAKGTGSGVVTITVSARTTTTARSATLTIAGRSVVITQ